MPQTAWFATVFFPHTTGAQQVLDVFTRFLPPRTPVYAVFEQRGTSETDIGAAPHLHIVVLAHGKMTHRAMVGLVARAWRTRYRGRPDIVVQHIDAWRAADLIWRYLAGGKKGYDAGERETTQRWRWLNGLPMFINRYGAKNLARSRVTQAEMQSILHRKSDYFRRQ